MTDPTFQQLSRAPAYQAVAAQIKNEILSGRIGQGSYLPTEIDLAEQLGVTRQTVREAIRLLENSGLVERGKQRRLRVARPSHTSLHASQSDALLLHGITCRELWEFEMALDPGIAALAAAYCSDDHPEAAEMMSRLRRNLRDTEEALSNPEALVQADVEFHALLAEATGNRAIQLARVPTTSIQFPGYSRVLGLIGTGKRLLDAHTRIVNAVADGDAAEAAEWMAKHIRDFRSGCELAGLDFDAPVDRAALAPPSAAPA